ncbi:MAG: hypothetical protein LUC45_06635, partial [Paraprevotella sp.]|nr:hypothetical protein [Paraprevotella sp.]
VYRYMEQCDSVERATVEKHQFHFRTSARKILLAYRPNLLNGGRFYMKKNSYTEAYRFLDLYLSSAEYPLLKKMFLSQTDSMYARVAYWITIAGYRIGAYDGVVRYAPIALRFPENQNFVQEYLCRSYLAMNDSAAWLDDLKKGFVNFPDHTYFFTSLQSYLNGIGKYDDALHFADRMVQSDPKNPLFWFAKAVIYMNKDYYRNCITNCDIVLTLDSAHINANYFKGLSYCNLAKASSDAMRKEDFRSENYHKLRADMMQYYTLAETPLENMRRLAPDKAVSWAPLLYQVYLHLNKGDEFEEMEHIVDSLVIPEKK